MKSKQRKLKSTISISELILSAVYFLQKKNGVTAKDITKYICSKRGCKQSNMRNKVKEALDRGIRNGIFNMKRGLYKVDDECKKKLTSLKKKVKKKSTNKTAKKIQRGITEAKKLSPVKENSKKSKLNESRVDGCTLSEDIFDRRERENSYFEPSVLAPMSDEEFDDFDDDDDYDNEDYESSESEEKKNLDIFTVTCREDPSHEKFPELNIYMAARQTRQRKGSETGKEKAKTCKRGRKKMKPSRPTKRKARESEKKKPEEDDDDEDADPPKQKQGNESRFDEEESEFTEENDHCEFKMKTGEVKGQKTEDVKADGEANKINRKQKPTQGGKRMKIKRESSEDNVIERSEMKKSSCKSDSMMKSSMNLLRSDLKLSFSPNMAVSDVKFSTTNLKLHDASLLSISENVKNEQLDHPVKNELFGDFEILSDYRPSKQQHLDCFDGATFSEPNQNQPIANWSNN